jgi:O-antigen/teichoic acid export membrane protein
MLGIISTAIILSIVFAALVILINSGLLCYLTRLMDFDDKSFKSALTVAILLCIVNLVLGIAVAFVKIIPFLLELLGVAVYVIVAYFLIRWKYSDEKKKHILLAASLLALFGFALSLLAVMIISVLFNALTVI